MQSFELKCYEWELREEDRKSLRSRTENWIICISQKWKYYTHYSLFPNSIIRECSDPPVIEKATFKIKNLRSKNWKSALSSLTQIRKKNTIKFPTSKSTRTQIRPWGQKHSYFPCKKKVWSYKWIFSKSYWKIFKHKINFLIFFDIDWMIKSDGKNMNFFKHKIELNIPTPCH